MTMTAVDGAASAEDHEFGPTGPGAARLCHPFEQDMAHSDEAGDFPGRDGRDQAVDRPAVSQPPSWSAAAHGDDAAAGAAPPSNETLLGTAFLTFMGFALLELCFASLAGSEAMMGDAAAMSVDSLTYLFNYCAERRKARMERDPSLHRAAVAPPSEAELRREQLARRKQVLQMEIVPPLLSASTLLVITVVVVHQAIATLRLDLHRSRAEQHDPNVNLMLTFSFLNLILDCLNVFCFAKAKHLLGYPTLERWDNVDDEDDEEEGVDNARRRQLRPPLPLKLGPNASSSSYALVRTGSAEEGVGADTAANGRRAAAVAGRSHTHLHAGDDGHANLNMCSAYTHVFADTLRSIAVLVAAALAKLAPGVTPEEADAAAAVFVSVLIVLSLIPLLQGLWRSVAELNAILAIERQEALFPEHRMMAAHPA